MDSPEQFLKIVFNKLVKMPCTFSLAGGFVASLYRQDIRATNDLDFVLQADTNSFDMAQGLIMSLGMEVGVARLSDLTKAPMPNKKSLPRMLVIGRTKNDPQSMGLDFILPTMPWVKKALERAQINKINFGFANIPCLTLEDFILSKLYALKNDPSRFKDLDDLKSIFEKGAPMDLDYLASEMESLQLAFPKTLYYLIPKTLKLASRKKPPKVG